MNDNSDITTTNSSLFKHKSDLTGDVAANETVKVVKIAATLKYLSNFWRSLEVNLA